MGKDADGYEGVHGGFSIGRRNDEGRSLLEFCAEADLVVMNSWFKNEKKATFRSGGAETEIDFMLVGKSWRKKIRNVKVIPGELQHSLVVMDVDKIDEVKKKKQQQSKRTKTWKLKDGEVKRKFAERMDILWKEKEEDGDIWTKYRNCAQQAANEVCGVSKGKPRHGETWWWNEEVKVAIERKKESFKKMQKQNTEENKARYKRDKKKAKKAVAEAMKKEAEKELEQLQMNRQGIFQKLKIMKRESRDITESNCIKDKNGRIFFVDEDRRRIWKEHMESIMNQENQWDGLVEAERTEGPVKEISKEEIKKALESMKNGKAGGPSSITKEHFTSSPHGLEVLHQVANEIMQGKSMPEDWKQSTLVPIYKGKGSVMECGSYRGVKLLEHGMKLVERVLEKRLREVVKIDEMQYGFMPGKGTVGAIFIVRRMQECYQEKKKKLFMCFVDLEKAFDRVPRKVIEWALRKRNVPEALVEVVMKLYEDATTRVQVGSGFSEKFNVAVGVHQGSVLSPLLFVTVLDVLSESERKGVLFELLYADDLVLIAESMEELESQFNKWKRAFEGKGLKINMGKTKIMECGEETGVIELAKKDPCGVCGKRVVSNAIRCSSCHKWIHGRCTNVKRVTQRMDGSFECKACIRRRNLSHQDQDPDSEQRLKDLERVSRFCYLGDTINSSGGSELAVTRRTRLGWMKFNELALVLCGKRLPLKLKGKIYTTCVRAVMVYGSEAWTVRSVEEGLLRRTERAMIRKMCGVQLVDRKNTKELMERIGLKDTIVEVVRRSGLRWLGHVLRKRDDEGVKRVWNLEVEGKRGRGRPKLSWKELVMKASQKLGLGVEDAEDRRKWRAGVMSWKE